jgi:hypothetical protein
LPTKDAIRSQPLLQDEVAGIPRTTLLLGRAGRGDRIPTIWFDRRGSKTTVILAHPAGKSAYRDAVGAPIGLAKALLEQKCSLLLLDAFMAGEASDAEIANKRAKQVDLFFTTYNRTDAQERAQDLITACAYARGHGPQRIVLCGAGTAGLWALLAAPAADAVVADCAGLESASDTALLAPDIFVPGLRKIGGFEGVALLATPNPLLLHHTGEKFPVESLTAAYAGLKAAKSFQTHAGILTDAQIAEWIGKRK